MGEESDLKNLPGVGPATASKLKKAGFTTSETLSVTPPKEIAEKTGIGFNTVLNIVKAAREKLGIDFITAEDLWKKRQNMKRCTTGSNNLNTLMGGGIETQHVLPFGLQPRQSVDEKTHQHGKARELGRGTDKQRHRCRRALVNIGNPHVKGHGPELEGDTDDDEDQTKDQHHAAFGLVGDGLRKLAQIERARDAVEHRHPIEQHARRERAEHKILHGRLG